MTLEVTVLDSIKPCKRDIQHRSASHPPPPPLTGPLSSPLSKMHTASSTHQWLKIVVRCCKPIACFFVKKAKELE